MIIIADNITTTRPSVRRAVDQRDAGALADLCARLQRVGAHWLDLNPGYVRADRRRGLWRFLVETAESACDLTLVLDPPETESLAVALEFCSRPPVLNMGTALPERLDPMLDLAAAHGLRLIVAAMEKHVPPTADEKLALAALIISRAQEKGVPPERVLIDPMIMPLALQDGERHARAVIDTLRDLRHISSPPARSVLALSNLTTASAGVRARFAAGPFLAAAWGAGLDAVMMDALDPELRRLVRLCEVFDGTRVFAPVEFE